MRTVFDEPDVLFAGTRVRALEIKDFCASARGDGASKKRDELVIPTGYGRQLYVCVKVAES